MSLSWFKPRVSLAWVAGLVTLELVSWLTYCYPSLRGGVTLGLLLLILAVSCVRLRWGVYIALAELALGSQGYILALSLPQFNISFRLGLFLVLMLATVVDCIRQRRIYFFSSFFWKWYVALVTGVGVGVVIGYIHGNSVSNIFFDVNGYLFLGMILPFAQSIRLRAHVQTVLTVIISAVIVLTLQTLLIVFMFSHQILFQYYLIALYGWVRDFRLGEITRQDNGFYRVFFQSQMYVVFVLLFGLVALLQRRSWALVGLTAMSVMLLWLSYSRSFWLATVVVLIGVWGYLHFIEQVVWKKIGISLATILGSAAVTYILVLGIVNIPIGSDNGSSVGASSLLTERTDDPLNEAAGGSRIALLKPLLRANVAHPLLGSGLGTTVSYATRDPRALAANPDGVYTTFAFEWGYLDLWLKLGIFGTAVYLFLLALLMVRALSLKQTLTDPFDQTVLQLGAFGIVALVVVHALTPYLNHPLGIGWIVLITVTTDLYARSS